jgi:serpin B
MRSTPPTHASSSRLSIRKTAIVGVVGTLFTGMVQPITTLAADPPNSDQAEIVKGNNAFAVELYSQLRSQPGNLFFSPESISTALAMTYAGARGQTATEMAGTMHFTLPPDKLYLAMSVLLRDRNAAHDGYQLKEADALWGQQGYAFLPDFLNLTSDNYGAAFNQVDFKGATEAARQAINTWVEHQTENKITGLIAPGALDSSTRLVLTNTIYFKGDWQMQFKKNETKEEDLHVSSTQTIKTPLMHMTGGFNYYENIAFQVLEIPYKGNDLSMIVFLPKSTDGLAGFEQSLTEENIQQWHSQLRRFSEVIVTLPKFTTENQFELGGVLAAMGMKQGFGPEADFTGITSREGMQHDGNLYISAVIHKAFVEVNEEGTEAAAVTAIGMAPAVACGGCADSIPPPIIFRADHPFFFLIRDNMSGGILFMGRVTDPTK